MSNELKEFINNNALTQSQEGADGEKGSGIGLQVVKHLAKRNDASINIENGKEKGAVFTLNIPVAN